MPFRPWPAPLSQTLHRLALIAATLVGTVTTGRAADSSWITDGPTGAWATATNWSVPAGIPGATGTTTNTDTATFDFLLTQANAVTVDAGRNVLGITFNNAGTFGYTLSGGPLVLTTGGLIQTGAGNGAHTDLISSAIQIQGAVGGTATFTAGATNPLSLLSISGGVTGVATATNSTVLTLNGANTGANAITGIIGNGSAGGTLGIVKSGAGNWTLSGVNTFTGGLAIRAGTLTAQTSATALGATTNVVTLGDTAANAAAASLFVGSSTTYAQAIILGGGSTGTLTIGSATAGATNIAFSGGITGTNNLTINNGSTSGTTTISGAAGVNFAGVLTNASTSTGTVTVSAAVGANVSGITLNSTASALTVSGALTVNTAGTALTNVAGTRILTVSGAVGGTGNLVLSNNSGLALGVTVGAVNNTGTVTNSGTGAGTATITGIIGAGVTNVIQNSLTSGLVLTANNSPYTGAFTVRAGTLSGSGSGNHFGVGNVINLGNSTGSANATVSFGVGGTYTNPINTVAGSTGTLAVTAAANTIILSAGITLNNNPIAFANNGNSLTVNGGITGTGGVNVIGSGAAGTLTIGTTAPTFTGNLTDSRTGGASVFTVSAPLNITGAVSLANAGSGLTTFSGAIGSTVTGITHTGGNSLTISGATVANTGNFLFAGTGAGVVTFSAAAINTAGTITNQGTTTGTTTISGALGSSVTAVTQNSTSSLLSLTNANTAFAGVVNITAGFVQVGSGATSLGSGSVNISSNGALLIANNAQSNTAPITINGNGPDGKGAIRSVAVGTNPRYAGNIILGSDSSVASVTNSSTTSGILGLNGIISGGNSLTISTVYDSAQTTTATVSFGNGNNTFGGVGKFLTINDGTLSAGGASANTATAGTLGNPNTTVVLGDNVGAGNVRLTLPNGAGINANPITISSGTGTRTFVLGGGPTLSGPITLNKDLLFRSEGSTNTNSLTGGISGTGNVTIQAENGPTNTVLGGTINHSGTIAYTSSLATQVRLNISGSLGANVGLVSYTAPNAVFTSTFPTFTLSGNNTNVNGVSITAPGAVLNLASNTALGGTGNVLTMASGFLNNTSGVAVTIANNITVNNNSNFTFQGGSALDFGSAATFNINANRTITLQNTSIVRALSLGNVVGPTFNFTATGNGTTGFLNVNGSLGITTGNVAVNGGATLTLNGTSSFGSVSGGTITIGGGASAGTLAFAVASDGGVAGSLGQSSAAASNLVFDGTTATLRYVGTTPGSTDRNFTLTTDGLIEASGTVAGAVTFAGSPSLTTARTLSLGGTGLISASSAGTYSGLLADGGGPLSLAKVNTGTWFVTNANTYTGTTTVLAGNLIAGANAPSGAAGAFGISTTDVLLGDTAGTAAAGLLTGGAFTVGRNVTVQAGSTGTATLGGSAAANSTFGGTVTLNKGATLAQAAGGAVTFGGTITGGFGLTVGSATAAGTVVLAGPNTYSGGTTVSFGTLLANTLGPTNSATGAGGVTVNAGATLGGTGRVAGAVAVGGAVRGGTTGQATAAAATLTVDNTVTIGTNGILRVEAADTVPSGGFNASSRIALTGAGVLNLNPGGGTFTIDLVSNAATPLVLGTSYTFMLVTAPTPTDPTLATPFQLNGAPILTNGTNPTTIGAGNYTLTSASFSAFESVSLAVNGAGDALILTATPAPEPATALLAASGLLAGVSALRRRRPAGRPIA